MNKPPAKERKSGLKVIALFFGIWFTFWLCQSLATMSDVKSRGMDIPIPLILLESFFVYLPWFPFSFLLYFAVEHYQDKLYKIGTLFRLSIFSIIFFFIPNNLYTVIAEMRFHDITWARFLQGLKELQAIFIFIDFIVFVSLFASIYAFGILRLGILNKMKQQKTETENLNLRLELEEQKLSTLKAQLEPHFLFNSLNAISALVRSEDKAAALTALNRLSELLRYALGAGDSNWVSLEEEMRFVRGYLELQKLRYGSRLRIEIEGESEEVQGCDCPPLLLQPLVENALRHDLECHEHDSKIEMRFRIEGDKLKILLSNGVHPGAISKPGFGLGLRNTHARLELLYQKEASLVHSKEADRFLVQMTIPRYGNE